MVKDRAYKAHRQAGNCDPEYRSKYNKGARVHEVMAMDACTKKPDNAFLTVAEYRKFEEICFGLCGPVA